MAYNAAHRPSVFNLMQSNVSKNDNNRTINIKPSPRCLSLSCRLYFVYPFMFRKRVECTGNKRTHDIVSSFFPPKTEECSLTLWGSWLECVQNARRTNTYVLLCPLTTDGDDGQKHFLETQRPRVQSTCNVIFHTSIWFFFFFYSIKLSAVLLFGDVSHE